MKNPPLFIICIVAVLVAAALTQTCVGQTPADPAWKSLFDGKTLGKWEKTRFGGEGDVTIEDGAIVMDLGSDMTGITWTGEYPKMDYEIELEAMRVDGADFFCGLTFPVRDDSCSLICGGWGGAVVGLSSLDGHDASDNETTQAMRFKDGRWYTIRVRVTKDHIEAWIDGERIINAKTTGRKISIRSEVEMSKPLGLATWQTKGAARNIKIRNLEK